jgi:hypothetical protein
MLHSMRNKRSRYEPLGPHRSMEERKKNIY